MFTASAFRPKTITGRTSSAGIPGRKVNAIDIGFGQVKVWTQNGYAVFPAYVKDITDIDSTFIGEAPDNYIMIRDLHTGKTWAAGEQAVENTDDREIASARQLLYSPDRYTTENYKVLVMAAIAMCETLGNGDAADGREIYIETGLPSNQMDNDQYDRRNAVTKAFAGRYDFIYKIGNGKETPFHYTVDSGNITVIKQPMGGFYSMLYDNMLRHTPNDKILIGPDKKILMLDAGTKTVIVTQIANNSVQHLYTFDNCGMNRILTITSDEIFRQYKVRLTHIEIQKAMKKGTIQIFDEETFTEEDVDFTDILEKAAVQAFDEVFDRLRQFVKIQTYDVLVVNGGTSSAWRPYIREKLKGLKRLHIMDAGAYYIDGKLTFDIPAECANCCGYYKHLCNKLKRR